MTTPPKPVLASNESELKTSQRVAAIIFKYHIFDDPIHVDSDEIGADWCNRMGSDPNIAICHEVLAPSFKKDGYDPSKPQVGILRAFEGHPDLLLKLLEWNMRFSAGDERWPPIDKQKMNKGSLACTHVNLTARMFKHEMTTKDGMRCTTGPAEENKACADLVRIGHKWHVLRGDTPDDDATLASTWFNSTNNSAQVTHEIEHIRGLQRVCKKEAQTHEVLVLSTVVSKAMFELKLQSQSMILIHLARWVTMQGIGEFVDMLCNFHSGEVNPNELTVSPSLFGAVAQELPKSAVNFKLD
ncbi:MAG: hypothetical protein VYB08_04070, partial [Candidatus Latescibacterota bacterium]|nr:hypothetical protein [Candidatus Latescibacterota bacterium]